MSDLQSIVDEINGLIDFYDEFRKELKKLINKFGETENLKAELQRVEGKLEALQELKSLIK